MAFQKITETTYSKIKNKLSDYDESQDTDNFLYKRSEQDLEILVQQLIDGSYKGHFKYPYDPNKFIENLKKYGTKGLYMNENQTSPE